MNNGELNSQNDNDEDNEQAQIAADEHGLNRSDIDFNQMSSPQEMNNQRRKLQQRKMAK